MQIRQAVAADFDEVWQVVQEAIAALLASGSDQWGDFYPTSAHFEADIQHGHLFVAHRESKIIGLVALNDEQDPQYDEVWWKYPESTPLVVHRLIVSPSHQNQGIATQIMRFAEQHALDSGFDAIRLDAYKNNPASLKLYEHLGYSVVGRYISLIEARTFASLRSYLCSMAVRSTYSLHAVYSTSTV